MSLTSLARLLHERARMPRPLIPHKHAMAVMCLAASMDSFAWQVTKARDEFTDQTVIHACIRSENSVRQRFPYNHGSTYARLCLKRAGGHINVLVAVNQGQLPCALETGGFGLRIDDGPPKGWGCVGSTSNDPEIGYFEDDTVASVLASAQTLIRIQSVLYNHGEVVFRFNVKGKQLPKEFRASSE